MCRSGVAVVNVGFGFCPPAIPTQSPTQAKGPNAMPGSSRAGRAAPDRSR